jgi:hypothetical protein
MLLFYGGWAARCEKARKEEKREERRKEKEGGRQQNRLKPVTPVVGEWVKGQKTNKKTRAQGQFCFDIFVVFFSSPHRETPKNVIKNF